jgi:hypothetical protein
MTTLHVQAAASLAQDLSEVGVELGSATSSDAFASALAELIELVTEAARPSHPVWIERRGYVLIARSAGGDLRITLDDPCPAQ